MPSEGSRSADSPDTTTIRGAAAMTFGDELMYELWRTPHVLILASSVTLAFFCAWAAYGFLANLPMTWNEAIQEPDMAVQEISRFVFQASLNWLPLPVLFFYFDRQLTWLRHRFGAGRSGITYEINEVGIVSRYGQGYAITMPWATTKRSVKTKRLLLLRSKWGWWYLPWRALNPVDQKRLWTYAQERIAAAKKQSQG